MTLSREVRQLLWMAATITGELGQEGHIICESEIFRLAETGYDQLAHVFPRAAAQLVESKNNGEDGPSLTVWIPD
jgi:hypothetical protein